MSFNITHFQYLVHDKWVHVTMAWHFLRLGKDKQPPDMEGSCEYTE